MKRYCEYLFYIVTIIMIVTGLFMHSLGGLLVVKILHASSGVIFTILLVCHVLSSRKKMSKGKKDHVS